MTEEFQDTIENLASEKNIDSDMEFLSGDEGNDPIKAFKGVSMKLSKPQLQVQKLSNLYPTKYSEMIKEDCEKFIKLIGELSNNFEASDIIDEKITFLAKANYIANIILNIYPHSINDDILRRLTLINFKTLIDEKFTLSNLNAVLWWFERINLLSQDMKDMEEWAYENKIWKKIYDRYFYRVFTRSKVIIGNSNYGHFSQILSVIVKKVRRIFKKDFNEIFTFLQDKNINLSSIQGQFMVNNFISIKSLEPEDLETFLVEYQFKLENFKVRLDSHLEIYADQIQNKHFQYNESDNSTLTDYFFELPQALQIGRQTKTSRARQLASHLAITVNTIIWKTNLSTEDLNKFFKLLSNIFEMMVDKIHPYSTPNQIGKFFVLFFDKFVATFVDSYNRSKKADQKKLRLDPMTEIFKKIFEVLAFGHRDLGVDNYVFLNLFVLNKSVFVPFILEKFRIGFEDPEISKKSVLFRLKNLIKFVIEDSQYSDALYWIMPNLKQLYDDVIERNLVIDLSQHIQGYFPEFDGFTILPHIKNMKDNFLEYAKWIFNAMMKEDSALIFKFSFIRCLWDMGKEMQSEMTKAYKKVIDGKWMTMKFENAICYITTLYEADTKLFKPMIIDFIYENLLEKLDENDMKREDLMLNEALEANGITLKHKLKVEAEPSVNTVQHIKNVLRVIQQIAKVPKMLEDDELINLYQEIVILGLANKSEGIKKSTSFIGYSLLVFKEYSWDRSVGASNMQKTSDSVDEAQKKNFTEFHREEQSKHIYTIDLHTNANHKKIFDILFFQLIKGIKGKIQDLKNETGDTEEHKSIPSLIIQFEEILKLDNSEIKKEDNITVKNKIDTFTSYLDFLVLFLSNVDLHPRLINNENGVTDDLNYIKIELGWQLIKNGLYEYSSLRNKYAELIGLVINNLKRLINTRKEISTSLKLLKVVTDNFQHFDTAKKFSNAYNLMIVHHEMSQIFKYENGPYNEKVEEYYLGTLLTQVLPNFPILAYTFDYNRIVKGFSDVFITNPDTKLIEQVKNKTLDEILECFNHFKSRMTEKDYNKMGTIVYGCVTFLLSSWAGINTIEFQNKLLQVADILQKDQGNMLSNERALRIYSVIYAKTEITDKSQIKGLAENSNLLTTKYDNVYQLMTDVNPQITNAEEIPYDLLLKLITSLQRSFDIVNPQISQAIIAITIRFQRRLMRLKKEEAGIEQTKKLVKVYLKHNEGESEGESDLLEKWFAICNEVLFEDQEALNNRLESNSSLKQFYETNKEELSKINKNFRVLELNSMYLSLPFNFKKLYRFTEQNNNCLLQDQLNDETLEVPVKNINDLLEFLVESEKEYLNTGKSTITKFTMWIAEKITSMKSKHQAYGQRCVHYIFFVESLFMIYGPSLFHKTKGFFEKNSQNMGAKEYVNVFFFYMTAALRASAYYTEDQFDEIFEWSMKNIKPLLTETKENLIESISQYLISSFEKQSYGRYEKAWKYILEIKNELAESSRYLLFPIILTLLNNCQGLRPPFVVKEFEELLEIKIEKVRVANFVNLAVRQLVKFVYKPTNTPKKLPQLSLNSNLSEKYIFKECNLGAQSYYENIIKKSLEAKNQEVTFFWLRNLPVTFHYYTLNKKWESLFFIYPKLFIELGEIADEETLAKVELLSNALLKTAQLISMTEESKQNFSKVLIEEYNKVDNYKIKSLLLIWIVNNVYRGSHKACELELFKGALVDPRFTLNHNISNLCVNYMIFLDLDVIDSILKNARKVVYDKKSDLNDVAREGLLIVHLLRTKNYDYYSWMEEAFNIVLEAKFRNKKIREKIKSQVGEFFKHRAGKVVYKSIEIDEEILREIKSLSGNQTYFS